MFNPNTNHVIVQGTNGFCTKSLTTLFADLGYPIDTAPVDTNIDVSAQNIFLYCDNTYKLLKTIRISPTQDLCNYLITNNEIVECSKDAYFLVKGLDAIETKKTITNLLPTVSNWKVKNSKTKEWTSFKIIPAIHNISLVNLEVDGTYFSINNLIAYNIF